MTFELDSRTRLLCLMEELRKIMSSWLLRRCVEFELQERERGQARLPDLEVTGLEWSAWTGIPQSEFRNPQSSSFRHLIVDRFQGALEHGPVCRVSSRGQLGHDT